MKRKNISTGQRFDILNRDNFTCRYCGRSAPDVKLHIDHIVPVSKGGAHHPDNFVVACQDCNLGKNDKLLHESSIDIKKFIKRAEDKTISAYEDRVYYLKQKYKSIKQKITDLEYKNVLKKWETERKETDLVLIRTEIKIRQGEIELNKLRLKIVKMNLPDSKYTKYNSRLEGVING